MVRKSSTGAQGKQRLSGGELRSWWSSSDTRDDRPHGAVGRPEVSEDVRATGYLPAARRCQRVRFSIFLCFFLRMRLRRFLMREPMRPTTLRSEEHTSELQSPMRRSYAVFCLKKKLACKLPHPNSICSPRD